MAVGLTATPSGLVPTGMVATTPCAASALVVLPMSSSASRSAPSVPNPSRLARCPHTCRRVPDPLPSPILRVMAVLLSPIRPTTPRDVKMGYVACDLCWLVSLSVLESYGQSRGHNPGTQCLCAL